MTVLNAVPTASIIPHISNYTTDNSTTTGAFHFPVDDSLSYVVENTVSPLEELHLENTMSQEELYKDLTIMDSVGSNDLSWWAQDTNPQFAMPDLTFDTTAFGSTTSTDCNILFDTPPSPAFGNEQFPGPSSTFTTASDFTSINLNNNLSFSGDNASLPSQHFDASFLEFQPTQVPAPGFPHTALPAYASPSNASRQPTATLMSNLPLAGDPVPPNATSNASPQPTTTPPPPLPLAGNPETSAIVSVSGTSPSSDGRQSGGDLVPSNATSNASPQPTTTSLSPLSNLPLAGNPETSAIASVSGTSIPGTSSSSDGRRSGRNPVPSKRHEQMNEIDGKGNNKSAASAQDSAHIEKENIPPGTTPEWAIASHDYLNSDLGMDWTACVQAWFELERTLGYGSQAGAKVCNFFLFKLDIGFNLCDRELYRSQQLVHRSGQVGQLSRVVASAASSLPLQLLMRQSLELPYRVGGIASSRLFASQILGFLPPSTPVQRAT